MDSCSLNGASENNHIHDIFLQIGQVILPDRYCYVLVEFMSYRIHYPFNY